MSEINYKNNLQNPSQPTSTYKKYSPVAKSRTKLVISIEVITVSSSKGVLAQLHNQSHRKGHQVKTNRNLLLIKSDGFTQNYAK